MTRQVCQVICNQQQSSRLFLVSSPEAKQFTRINPCHSQVLLCVTSSTIMALRWTLPYYRYSNLMGQLPSDGEWVC